MSFPHCVTQARSASILAIAALFAAGVANAQSALSPSQPSSSSSQSQSSSSDFSSSQAGLQEFASLALPSAPEPASSASAGNASGAGQYGNGGNGGGAKTGMLHNWAFEVGGGFNAPESSSVTFGGQFTVGAGLNFTKRIAGLIEYQFLDAKLPGYLIAEAGANGGYAHIWSFTFDPKIDLMPKAKNDVYITGGGGFYRKVTSFTDPEEAEYCEYYGCGIVTENAVVGHFSSNQGGYNVGAGLEHKFGGMYGDSRTAVFAEARYLYVDSPAVTTQPNGLGTTTVAAGTKIIPVDFGVRF